MWRKEKPRSKNLGVPAGLSYTSQEDDHPDRNTDSGEEDEANPNDEDEDDEVDVEVEVEV